MIITEDPNYDNYYYSEYGQEYPNYYNNYEDNYEEVYNYEDGDERKTKNHFEFSSLNKRLFNDLIIHIIKTWTLCYFNFQLLELPINF